VRSVISRCLASLLLTSALLTPGHSTEAAGPRDVAAKDQTVETVFLTNTGTVRVTTSGCRSCADTRHGAGPLIGAGEGYVAIIAAEPSTQWLGGLTLSPQNNAQDLAFAIYFTGVGAVEVREHGVPRASIAQSAGDVFRITVSSHGVRYSKNTVVFYTSARIPTDQLRFTAARLPHRSGAPDSGIAPLTSGSSPLDGRRPLASGDQSVPMPAVTLGVAERIPGTLPGPDARLAGPNLPSDFADSNQGAVVFSGGGTTGGGSLIPGNSLLPPAIALLPPAIASVPAAIPASPGAGGASGTLATVQFVGVGHDGVLMPSGSFSEPTLRDLLIDVTWNLPGGGHTQRVELFSPDGALYQRFRAPIGTAAPQTIETRVPVGGTWMTQHSLFGGWSVVVYLDDDTIPATSTGFVFAQ
jgi:hypothetical protein